jgi:DNA mismatch repair protein MSH6
LSLKECVNVDSPSKVLFGVCFVDTSTGHFFLSEFGDDLDRSLLETLLVQINVKEIVYERGKLSVQTKKLLKNLCGEDASWNGLKVNDEFWDAKRTQEEVLRRSYFKELPDLLKGNNESVSAFGGLVWYLSQLKLDESLIKHENIKYYDILESKTSMVLDGQSLINLEIFETTEGTKEGPLFELINHCLTPFGKRKLKKWICHPLQDTQKIEQRLNSVDLLMKTSTIEIEKVLKKCPDFERLLSRCMARKLRLKDYPGFIESLRTVLNKIESFKNELNSSENSLLMQNIDEILACKENLGAELKRISASFDTKKAKDGELEIFEGFEEDYDDIVAVNKKIVNELNKHLADVREKFQCKEVEYRDIGKEIFQLQFPAKYADKVPSNWATKSSSKAVVRYYSPFLVDKVREYQEAQETLNSVRGELLNRYLDKLNAFAVEISIIAKNLGDIDCLLSLAKVSSQLKGMSNGDACRPVFLDKKMINGNSMIMFKNLRHPCLINNNYNNNVFIPNDIHLGNNFLTKLFNL